MLPPLGSDDSLIHSNFSGKLERHFHEQNTHLSCDGNTGFPGVDSNWNISQSIGLSYYHQSLVEKMYLIF